MKSVILATVMKNKTVIETISLQPDAAAGIDAYIYEAIGDGQYGSNPSLMLNSAGGIRRSGLIKFDLSSIPEGATIVSAKLHVWSSDDIDDTYANHCSVHAILAANSGWIENGASWDYAASGVRWAGDSGADGGPDAGCSVSGTDYNATALGSWTCEANTPADTEYSIDLDKNQMQIVLANNYGFLIKQDDQGGLIGLRSSDYADESKWPRLEVAYINP